MFRQKVFVFSSKLLRRMGYQLCHRTFVLYSYISSDTILPRSEMISLCRNQEARFSPWPTNFFGAPVSVAHSLFLSLHDATPLLVPNSSSDGFFMGAFNCMSAQSSPTLSLRLTALLVQEPQMSLSIPTTQISDSISNCPVDPSIWVCFVKVCSCVLFWVGCELLVGMDCSNSCL